MNIQSYKGEKEEHDPTLIYKRTAHRNPQLQQTLGQVMGYLDAFPAVHAPVPPTSSPWPPSAAEFPSSSSSTTVPLRSERAQCWHARDSFFACLDKHGVVDSLHNAEGQKVAETQCAAEDMQLKRDCVTSWVSAELELESQAIQAARSAMSQCMPTKLTPRRSITSKSGAS